MSILLLITFEKAVHFTHRMQKTGRRNGLSIARIPVDDMVVARRHVSKQIVKLFNDFMNAFGFDIGCTSIAVAAV